MRVSINLWCVCELERLRQTQSRRSCTVCPSDVELCFGNEAENMQRSICCVHTHCTHKHLVQLVLWNIPDLSTKTHSLGISHHHCGQTQNTGHLQEATSFL